MGMHWRMILVLLMSLGLLEAGCASTSTGAPVLSPRQESREALAMLGDLRAKAIEQILASSRSKDPFQRANAIEASQALPQRVIPFVQLGMDDPNPAVRFVALATIGKLKLREVAPGARRLLNDPNPSVRAAAMFALRNCGQKVDISPMSALLLGQDPHTRSNVAMLMGWMGDKSAVPLLKDAARVPMPLASEVEAALVRLQIAEAILRLGDNSVIDSARAALYSQFDEVRVLAVGIIGEIGDERFASALVPMLNGPPVEIRVAAAASLAELGHPDGLKVVLGALATPISAVRAQAAMALSRFADVQASQALGRLLDDPSEQVRLAAAAAIVKALNRARGQAVGG